MRARSRSRSQSVEPAATAHAATTALTIADVDALTVASLKAALAARGEAVDGLKAVLAARLRDVIAREVASGANEGSTLAEGGAAATGVKRKAEEGMEAAEPEARSTTKVEAVEGRATKRRRWDDAPAPDAGVDAAAPVAAAKPPTGATVKVGGLDKAALLKQKQALLKQKELAAKLKAAKAGGKVGDVPKASTSGVRPMALRLDAQGREIDERGQLVDTTKVIHTSTLRVNLKKQRADAFAQAQAEAQAEMAALGGDDFDDPRMAKVVARARKPRSAFQFVEDGVFQKEADMHRLRVQFGEDEAQKIKARELREKRHMEHLEKLEQEAAMDPNLVPIGERPSAARGASAARPIAPLDDIPDVEWWDKDILQNGSYDDVSHGKWNVNMDKFNLYVEHPIPIQPPLAPPAPASQPLMLTKAEQKKLRTQRRVAREKEKQEMIKQGLIEPPKPKVKISNLMRVMKDEAILDPTAIEREVREQMAEREQAHLDRNLARMLTPAERKEKKMRKLIGGDAAGEVHMHVYRIEDMSNTKNKFKVDINAQENHLAGVGLITDNFTVVIVEGTSKSVRRYDKLMMRRIDWNAKLNDGDDDDDDMGDDSKKNKCTRVWKGTSTKTYLKRFTFETLRTEAAARRFLEQVNLGHLWDAAYACVAIEDEE